MIGQRAIGKSEPVDRAGLVHDINNPASVQPPQADRTSDHGHDFAAITVFCILMIAPLVFGEAFRDDPQWQGLRRYSQISAPLSFGLFALYLFSSGITPGWAGLYQRVFTIAVLTWIVVVGARLARLRPTRRDSDEPAPTGVGEMR